MNKSRREFVKKGAVAGAITAAGVSAWLKDQGIKEAGEKVKLLSQDGQLIEVDKAFLKLHAQANSEILAKNTMGREGIPGRKFVMVVDLSKCNNARKCVTACQKMHYLPEDKEWLNVKLMKDNEQSAPYWFPKMCFHCDNPPCVKVCPVDATFKRADGLVLIDNQRCIGCKFCMAACPYSTRVFNWDEPDLSQEVKDLPYSPETSVPSQHGTVEKCDFCPDMVRKGKLPDCVTACPNGVFYFGDEIEDAVTNGDETVRLSELLRDRAGYRFMEDLGTKPRVYYLPPTGRMFPVERGFKDLTEEQKERYKDVNLD
ncbi:MAG: 4Fe-4S dicluster domain-containing protein [Cyclobacteriaceae bacterium]|nr:4Fe-4S dicluster domain-containing protein [Cyclobacteriaceae bacterium]